MREEHVDGGYLVTQGVYVGTEDFNKAVVRQLMVIFIPGFCRIYRYWGVMLTAVCGLD